VNDSSDILRRLGLVLSAIILLLGSRPCVLAQEKPSAFDLEVREMAEACRDQVTAEMTKLVKGNKLTLAQLFDTFYIPIPDTDPQKYHTQYDRLTDETIRIILDAYLEKDKRIKFVVAVDKNGYLPTHNSRYSKPLTGDGNYDTQHNRTKRMFNDRTGLAAARNEKPYLLQSYSRDTGEVMKDLSVPIYIEGQHWGAIRIGYQP
jgi:methyl-accepting chemotaxis protein